MSQRNIVNLFVVVGVIGFVATVGCFQNLKETDTTVEAPSADENVAESASAEEATSQKDLPKLLEIGAGKCVDCKKMAPIIEGLKSEYEGRVVVESIDVMKVPTAQREYKLRLIPTQILYDKTGKEVWRHEGFIPREDLVATMTDLGTI